MADVSNNPESNHQESKAPSDISGFDIPSLAGKPTPPLAPPLPVLRAGATQAAVAEIEKPLDPHICANCARPSEKGLGYVLPLCNDCRTAMVNRPFPIWIFAVSAIVGLAFLIALFQMPSSLTAGIAYERGQRAEKNGQHAEAARYYAQVAKKYPESTEVLVREAVAETHAHHYPAAIEIFDKLDGKEASKEQQEEVNAAQNDILRAEGKEPIPPKTEESSAATGNDSP